MKRLFITLFISCITSSLLLAEGYKVGDKATDFSLKNIDGHIISLKDFKDAKGFIIIFTCNHCPFSVAYEDRIIALDKKYKQVGFPVIAINPNDSTVVPSDSYSNMIVRAEEKNFPFPYLLDADQSITAAYGATRTPHVFLLQKKSGKLIVRYIGAIDDNYEEPQNVTKHYLSDAIDALLDNKKPNPDFTKAIGCSIKYQK